MLCACSLESDPERNKRRQPKGVTMLGQRRRRTNVRYWVSLVGITWGQRCRWWNNVMPTLFYPIVIVGTKQICTAAILNDPYWSGPLGYTPIKTTSPRLIQVPYRHARGRLCRRKITKMCRKRFYLEDA